MCEVCGCGESDHTQSHAHGHDHDHGQIIAVEQSVLAENDRYAVKNRQYFSERQIFSMNLVSSPGSGKTTLLTKTLLHYQGEIPMAVIVGDQHTDRDAQRLRQTGAPSLQINTGKMCHLDAHHIHHAVDDLSLAPQSVLWIENIGNLVCPALFDLGEASRVVLLSVTEGDDKPLKYPYMFHGADLLVINKIDLLPYVDFDMAACIRHAKDVNPHIQIVSTAATQAQGLREWFQWLQSRLQQHHTLAYPAPKERSLRA